MAGFLVGGEGAMAFVQGEAGSYFRPLHGGIFTTSDATESPNGETLVDAAYTGLTLRCNVSVNTEDSSDIVALRVNQLNSALAFAIPANTTGEFSDTGTVAISSGDDISIRLQLTDLGHDNAITLDWWTFEYSGTGDSTWIAAGGAAFVPENPDFTPIHNGSGRNAENDSLDWETAVATSLDNLRVVVTQNNLDATSTADIEEDGVAGAQQVSIPANTTGLLSDTAGTDDIDANDNLRWSVAPGAGMGGDTLTIASLSVRSSADAYTALADGGNSIAEASATRYAAAVPSTTAPDATEGDVDVPVEFAETVDRGAIGVVSNTRTTTTTFTLRDDAADADIVLSVPGATTGLIQDLSNSHAFVADDLIDWKVVTGTGTETLGWAYISVDVPQQAAPIDEAEFAGLWSKGQQEPVQTLPEVVSYG